MQGIDYIKPTTMVTKYRLFLYKLFTTPNVEGIQSQVSSTFWTMVLLQTANIASLLLLIRFFFPVIDFKHANNFVLFLLLTFPSIVFNYYCIYYQKGYKKILREYGNVKKGSLKYLVTYFLVTIVAFILVGLLVASE